MLKVRTSNFILSKSTLTYQNSSKINRALLGSNAFVDSDKIKFLHVNALS